MQDSDMLWVPCENALAESFGIEVANQPVTSLTFRHQEFRKGGGFTIYDNTLLTTISFPNLSSMTDIVYDLLITNNSVLASVSFPALVSLTSNFAPFASFLLNFNPLLTVISLPVHEYNNDYDYNFTDNALTQASVDAILAQAVATATFTSGRLRLQGGTNAVPSASGIIDKGLLNGRGVLCTTN